MDLSDAAPGRKKGKRKPHGDDSLEPGNGVALDQPAAPFSPLHDEWADEVPADNPSLWVAWDTLRVKSSGKVVQFIRLGEGKDLGGAYVCAFPEEVVHVIPTSELAWLARSP